MKIVALLLFCLAAPTACVFSGKTAVNGNEGDSPWVVVLGIAQDGGVPQAGVKKHKGWDDPRFRRMVVCLAVVDPVTRERWLIDATPDFKEQLHRLDELFPAKGKPGLDGIFLTHAHMGHYTGLMHLGHEAMGSREVPVHAMPRMRKYLSDNGPWSQLVRYKNIVLEPLEDRKTVVLNSRLKITPFIVPHRQEYSEVVGFRVEGPSRSVLFIPDIDSWEDWDDMGILVENEIARVDVAYLDGTFFSRDELPGRDISSFPHPLITHSMERFGALPEAMRAKVRFIHLNHTNPALDPGGDARVTIEESGFSVAKEMERVVL